MECEHPNPGTTPAKPLAWAAALTGSFFVIELVGGLWTGSLALVADSLHMGVDLIALLLSLCAASVSRRPPDAKRSFGYQRVEVLAALVNGVWLLVTTGVILREAYLRFASPREVLGAQMLGIALLGLVCNVTAGFILYPASHRNLNLRGAFLHVAADALGSLGAIAAAAVIVKTGWMRADPLASIAICLGIVLTSVWFLRDSVHILLEGVPPHIDLEAVRAELSALSGVREVHDLHLWSLSKGSESLSAHMVLAEGASSPEVLKAGTELLSSRFGLTHVTLQIES